MPTSAAAISIPQAVVLIGVLSTLGVSIWALSGDVLRRGRIASVYYLLDEIIWGVRQTHPTTPFGKSRANPLSTLRECADAVALMRWAIFCLVYSVLVLIAFGVFRLPRMPSFFCVIREGMRKKLGRCTATGRQALLVIVAGWPLVPLLMFLLSRLTNAACKAPDSSVQTTDIAAWEIRDVVVNGLCNYQNNTQPATDITRRFWSAFGAVVFPSTVSNRRSRTVDQQFLYDRDVSAEEATAACVAYLPSMLMRLDTDGVFAQLFATAVVGGVLVASVVVVSCCADHCGCRKNDDAKADDDSGGKDGPSPPVPSQKNEATTTATTTRSNSASCSPSPTTPPDHNGVVIVVQELNTMPAADATHTPKSAAELRLNWKKSDKNARLNEAEAGGRSEENAEVAGL